MKENEILEGNNLIDDFMAPDEQVIKMPATFYTKHCKYHSSWDWFMPVLKKIISLYNSPENDAYKLMNEIALSVAVVDIEGAWIAVVEFIKWHNSKSPA